VQKLLTAQLAFRNVRGRIAQLIQHFGEEPVMQVNVNDTSAFNACSPLIAFESCIGTVPFVRFKSLL
jgi:hypothetical protein